MLQEPVHDLDRVGGRAETTNRVKCTTKRTRLCYSPAHETALAPSLVRYPEVVQVRLGGHWAHHPKYVECSCSCSCARTCPDSGVISGLSSGCSHIGLQQNEPRPSEEPSPSDQPSSGLMCLGKCLSWKAMASFTAQWPPFSRTAIRQKTHRVQVSVSCSSNWKWRRNNKKECCCHTCFEVACLITSISVFITVLWHTDQPYTPKPRQFVVYL